MNENKQLSSNAKRIVDFDDAITTGFYIFYGNAANVPTATGGNLIVIASEVAISQIAIASNRLFVRRYFNSAWNEWSEK